ncbi:hypothetical protein [Paenibacillus sp. sgz302251]|uniref:hypothetical protein n=1 Tax=Paenibacillus sp. sgz302251 TaxID=3414493 RepID=UPI003C79D3E1
MRLSRLFLAIGIPLAVIFGIGGLIDNENPDYYKYLGLLGVVFVFISIGMQWFKKTS